MDALEQAAQPALLGFEPAQSRLYFIARRADLVDGDFVDREFRFGGHTHGLLGSMLGFEVVGSGAQAREFAAQAVALVRQR